MIRKLVEKFHVALRELQQKVTFSSVVPRPITTSHKFSGIFDNFHLIWLTLDIDVGLTSDIDVELT